MNTTVRGVLGLMVVLGLAGCALGSMDEPWDTAESAEQPQAPSPRVAEPEQAERAREEQRLAMLARGAVPVATSERGFYLDIQEGRLRRDLGAAGVSVMRRTDGILLRFPDRLTFEAGSDDLSGEVGPLLDAVADILIEYGRSLVTLYGHTDDSGPAEFNHRLSQRRAQAVARYLERRGVAPDRLLVVGVGESRPIAGNDDEEGRSQNRRVEILLEPLAG